MLGLPDFEMRFNSRATLLCFVLELFFFVLLFAVVKCSSSFENCVAVNVQDGELG